MCLDFVSANLADVLATHGYKQLTQSCPSLQTEILARIASAESLYANGSSTSVANNSSSHTTRAREPADEGDGRGEGTGVRPRLQ